MEAGLDEKDMDDGVVYDGRYHPWMMLINNNETGRDEDKALLLAKRWDIYMKYKHIN